MNQLQVDTVSHLVLQVYLGPTGKKQLYHINVTTVAGQHEGSLAILRRQNRYYHRYEHENRQLNGVHLLQDSNHMRAVKITIILPSSSCVHHSYYGYTHTSGTIC